MVNSVLVAAAGSGLLVHFLECLIVPRRGRGLQRDPACHFLHWGICLVTLSLLILILQRPYFALTVLGAFVFLVVMVNNAKFHSLREPFVFQDFEYFTDALKHPRLYLPFLGWWRAVAAIVVACLAIWAGFSFESSLVADVGWPAFFVLCGMLFGTGIVCLLVGHFYCPASFYIPDADLFRIGLLASLWRYGWDEWAKFAVPESPLPTLVKVKHEQADIIVVQSESFFDARRCYRGLHAHLLQEQDRLRQESLAWGQLAVPAWGANTVRTEFAFLSGLAAESLGVHRFNPYRRLAKTGVTTLASKLREVGYRTICVHPYPATFYERDRVYPLLGFDEFIDISAFRDAERCGPYISDNAVAGMIEKLLANRAQIDLPLFIYAITMENHGPLHLEKVAPGDVERLFHTPPPAGCDDLTVYARHLANADRMFGRLRQILKASAREGMLCVFGDHIPIMPVVYSQLAVPDGDTDYLVWNNRCIGGDNKERRLAVEELAPLLIRLAS